MNDNENKTPQPPNRHEQQGKALNVLLPLVRKHKAAGIVSVSLPTEMTITALEMALEAHNKAAMFPEPPIFQNLMTNAVEQGEKEGAYKDMDENTKNFSKQSLVFSGKFLDVLVNTGANFKLPAILVLSSISDSVGAYLYLMHKDNENKEEAIEKHIANITEAVRKSVKHFGDNIQGIDTIITRTDHDVEGTAGESGEDGAKEAAPEPSKEEEA